MKKTKIVGLDLAGVEHRPSGFCVLDGSAVQTSLLYTDDEIIKEIEKAKPAVVSIDAPLALPKGRKSLEDRSGPHLRECDKALLRMKIKFFPITLGPMRKLTERGIKIRKSLEAKGFKSIETFPGAAQDILKLPRKQKGLNKLRKSLTKFGLNVKAVKTDHELDAATCALVGKMYLEGKYMAIGNPEEVLMILPTIKITKIH